MSKQKKASSTQELVFVLALLGILLVFQYSRSFSYSECFLFIELIVSYIWISGLLIYAKIHFHLNVFEPISMITIIYEGIFIIKPIVDLRSHSLFEHGISVIEGGPKATLLFTVGYTLFYFSYYLDHKFVLSKRVLKKKKQSGGVFQENWLKWLYIGWAVTFALCIYSMLTQGLSLRYIFTFGTDGTRIASEKNTAWLFLSNFGITLVSIWLMILEYSRNHFVKIMTTLLCIVYILMRNARWLMLTFIIAPITLIYLKKKRQPRLVFLFFLGIAALLLFAWMQLNRAALASGGAMHGWGKEGPSLEILVSPLESDLSTYRTFYSMVTRYPSQYDFLYGITFLYVFILLIPRVIWPAKPDNPIRNVIEHSLNAEARASGTAVANIGEFYANYGIAGIVCIMYLMGWVTAYIKNSVFTPELHTEENRNRLMAYSVFFPLLFQWVARGNFSGNVYMTICAMLPFIILKVLQNHSEKNESVSSASGTTAFI